MKNHFSAGRNREQGLQGFKISSNKFRSFRQDEIEILKSVENLREFLMIFPKRKAGDGKSVVKNQI
jgi:hypothetical protein